MRVQIGQSALSRQDVGHNRASASARVCVQPTDQPTAGRRSFGGRNNAHASCLLFHRAAVEKRRHSPFARLIKVAHFRRFLTGWRLRARARACERAAR